MIRKPLKRQVIDRRQKYRATLDRRKMPENLPSGLAQKIYHKHKLFLDYLLKKDPNAKDLVEITLKSIKKLMLKELTKLQNYKDLDPTTGVLNKKAFLKELEKISQKSNFVVFYFDLNDLKKINDKYGHQFGDKLVNSLVFSILNTFDKNALIGRFGGDEFVVAVPKSKNILIHKEAYIEEINNLLHTFWNILSNKTEHIASTAIGIANGEKGSNIKEIISKAEQEMQKHKSNKNKINPKITNKELKEKKYEYKNDKTEKLINKYIELLKTEKTDKINYKVKKILEKLIAEAEIDKNTGLLNRYGFESRVKNILLDVKDAGLIFFDLNGLKTANDKYTHELGDLLIKTFAKSLERAFKGYENLIARLSGDEFVIFLPFDKTYDKKILKEINRRLQRLHGIFNQEWEKYNLSDIPASFAHGISTKSSAIKKITGKQDKINLDNLYSTMLELADKEMYKRKTQMKQLNPELKRYSTR